MLTLYDYYRSTASYRVRIALNLKGLPFDTKVVHLVNNGGEQFSESYRALNPQSRVPTLTDDATVIHQSIAMLEYLEETHPDPALLPSNPSDRAWIRGVVNIIACDIHPLNNLSVLKYLKNDVGVDDDTKTRWYHHWVAKGFEAIEALLASSEKTGKCCFGDTPTFADICLVAQVYNAHRFKCDMSAYPKINAVNEYCLSLEAFSAAAPE